MAKYLKEKNPNIKIWGVDTYGSVFKKYHETGIFDENEVYSYITEGIGEDILPKNVDFSLIDGFTKVTDKDAAIATRELARMEGILVGYSAGSAVAGINQLAGRLTKDDLVEAITRGGVALQEVLSSQLVAEGQMIRRERSFEGIEVNYLSLDAKSEEHRAIADNITEILRDIISFQSTYVDAQVEELDKIAVAEVARELEKQKDELNKALRKSINQALNSGFKELLNGGVLFGLVNEQKAAVNTLSEARRNYWLKLQAGQAEKKNILEAKKQECANQVYIQVNNFNYG